MITFLRVLGVISLIGGIIGAVAGMPNVGGAAASLASGVVTCAVFSWMAGMRDAVEDAADTLDEIAGTMKAIAKQLGAEVPEKDRR